MLINIIHPSGEITTTESTDDTLVMFLHSGHYYTLEESPNPDPAQPCCMLSVFNFQLNPEWPDVFHDGFTTDPEDNVIHVAGHPALSPLAAITSAAMLECVCATKKRDIWEKAYNEANARAETLAEWLDRANITIRLSFTLALGVAALALLQQFNTGVFS